MQGRSIRCLLHGGSRNLAPRSTASTTRQITSRLQYRVLSTTPSLRSPDNSGNPRRPGGQQPKPRERSQAAAESLAGLRGPTSASPASPLSQRLDNKQFAGPTNVRSLPRRPLEHRKVESGSGAAQVVKPPDSLASRGVVRAPSSLGRGRGGGAQGARPGGPRRLGGGGDDGPGTFSSGGRFGGSVNGRGGGGSGRGGRKGGRSGMKTRKRDDAGKRDSAPQFVGLGTTPEEKAWMAQRELGQRVPYVPPAVTSDSLAGWGPAVPSSAGSRGVTETAMRAMRILGGGQPFEPSANNDPVDSAERYQDGKPVFFSDREERKWLVENSDLKQVHIASEETKAAIVNAAIQGRHAPPRYTPAGPRDPLAHIAMCLGHEATYKPAEFRAFTAKFASLLPGAASGGPQKGDRAPKQARG